MVSHSVSHSLSPSIGAAALLLLSSLASAQTTPAPDATPDAAPAAATATQLTPAAKAKLAPRRPTRQIVGSPLPVVTEGYRPTLNAAPPEPIGTLPVHPTPSNAAPLAPLPVPVLNCSGGSCNGTDGVRYNAGAAGVAIDPAGRTCHHVGTTMQCF